MKRLAIALALLAGGCSPASDSADAPGQAAEPKPPSPGPKRQSSPPASVPDAASAEERALRLGMTWDPKQEARASSVNEFMAAYADKGLIADEPDFR